MVDKGIFPLSYLVAHDIWSLCCVIMAWYTLKDSQAETFSVYSITLNDHNFRDTFTKLQMENINRYNIIVSLFDRNVSYRINNFNNVSNDIIPVIQPNWNDDSVTLKAREELREWRCESKKISTNLNFGEDCDSKIPIPVSFQQADVV